MRRAQPFRFALTGRGIARRRVVEAGVRKVMKILAGADFHGDHEVYGWFAETATVTRADALVLAGDLLGVPVGFETVELAQKYDASRVVSELHRPGVPVLYIMGNDDLVELDPADDHFIRLNFRQVELGGWEFAGYQYSLPFMGGVNEKPEDAIAADLEELQSIVHAGTVLVTHSPAYGVLDPGFLGICIGSTSLLALITEKGVRAHIHGHSHAGFGRKGRHFNVAAGGHKRAMLIDLDSLTHSVVGG